MNSASYATRRSINMTGAIITGLAVVPAAIAFWFASFTNTYCGDAPTAQDIADLRRALSTVVIGFAFIPAVFAGIAHLSRAASTAVPWWIVSGLALLVGLSVAWSAQPSHYCWF
jgi:hypothetical protein